MLDINLENNTNEPLYLQVFNLISKEILNGELKEGTKLPPQRKLAQQLNISINTVVTAYYMLVQYDYVISSERSGYYVNSSPSIYKNLPERRWHSRGHSSIYNFSKNGSYMKIDNEFKQTFRKSVKICTDESFAYPDYTGDYDLRKQICSMLYKNMGIRCTPTQVVIGAGIENILGTLMCVIGNDKTYALENPSNYKISNFMKLNCDKIQYINITTDGLSCEHLKTVDADVLFLMPYHHYSVCYTMTEKQRLAVLDWAEDGKFVIEYGLDMDFVYSDKVRSLFSMTKNKNVVFIGDFTKSVAPEIATAYLVLPENLVKLWQKVYLLYHSRVSRVEQTFLSEIIKNKSYFRNVDRLYKQYRNKLEIAKSCIDKHKASDKMKFINGGSGTTFLLEVISETSEEDLIERAHEAGVKLSYIKNALEKPNSLISPKTFLLGIGELEEKEIVAGLKLLLDTWFPML